MEKEKYEDPNLLVLNDSDNDYGIQPMVILLVFVVVAGIFAIFGATQVHGIVNVDTYTTVS